MPAMLEQRRARLRGELGDVAWVRRSIADWLRDWELSGLAEDVELVASELVTNAILHAGGEIDVVLERRGAGVRVLVRDGAPEVVPTRRSPPARDGAEDDELDLLARSVFAGTTTGRGLMLVEAFSDAWGAEVAPASKEVWAELGTGRAPDTQSIDDLTTTEHEGVTVRLSAVPVRLILLSAANLDDLIRELQTTEFATPEPSRLAALGEQLVQATAGQREPLREAARHAPQHRTRRVDVAVELPPGQVAVLRRFVSLTGQVEHFCRTGVLLSQAPTEEVTAFRCWCVDEMDRQMRGEAPTPCPFPD